MFNYKEYENSLVIQQEKTLERLLKEYDDVYIMNANELINTKIRKILGYKSSLELFMIELDKLTQLTI